MSSIILLAPQPRGPGLWLRRAEIAAFLTGRAAVEKRISRGKNVLASARKLFDLADADIGARLATVQRCARTFARRRSG